MKCNKCKYDWSNLGDSAHVCGPVKVKQQEQGEPVAKVVEVAMLGVNSPAGKQVQMCVDLPVGTKLYTTPQQRKPLTDEQLTKIWVGDAYSDDVWIDDMLRNFARAIEAAHGIKENT